ncbi:Glycoside hydrolase family 13 protein [Mycena chlorophos]|uniref:Glycoside hydrolase family 13 protein n=1 Tax=Mycena chlorophos TaxID=658473 RepID=A0A8H6TJF1_MYCCL|nr:Glycoside hydrolase family 13 protein [Mycena chlorophos]
MFGQLKERFRGLWAPEPALKRMQLAPNEQTDNPLMLQSFTWDTLHPTLSWWQHVEQEIPRLAAMGVTQIWLPPPNKGANQTGRGYDAYDLWDLGEFDQKGTVRTRWGTREELLSACATARKHGVDVLIDAVLNHKIGADRCESALAVPVNPQNRLEETGPQRTIDAWTAFDFKGRGEKYSSLKWNQQHFSGGLRRPGSIGTTNRAKVACIGYRDLVIMDGPNMPVDKELGNYDYLLGIDIDHRHPEVRKDLLDWGVWILETTGASGFRLDAIKHIDYRFVLEFLRHARTTLQWPGIFAVSEYWSSDLDAVLPYIKTWRGATTFFDVPLHSNFHNASKQGARFDLRRILDKTIVQSFPNDAYGTITFFGDVLHLKCFYHKVVGQSLESWVGAEFKLHAYAIILLRAGGHPCVFYGDLYPNAECGDPGVEKGLPPLIEARKRFAYGPCKDYFLERNCIGFVRLGDSKHPGCVVVLSNGKPGKSHLLRMFVGKESANATYRAFLPGSDARITIDSRGWGSFPSSDNGVQVWVREEFVK